MGDMSNASCKPMSRDPEKQQFLFPDIQTITVLGSTGSIGVNTLDVVRQHRDKFPVFALTAEKNIDTLFQQCIEFNPVYAVLLNSDLAHQLEKRLVENNCSTQVLVGVEALQSVAAEASVDTVVAAIVGGAGLKPTLAAVNAGKKVLLANKESLVMAGNLFMEAVGKSGSVLLPIDSEHNAIFQCLPANHSQNDLQAIGIKRILLTGSGGPFRSWSTDAISRATPEQACNHPNWSMGRKISVDSATLMNKGLELIEAKWLFNVSPEMIEVLIHPQSIIHSMVEYVDGSTLAQLGHPDMRTPIAHVLAWPNRIALEMSPLDLIKSGGLTFEKPDLERFPALSLAMQVAESHSGLATVLNAANEVAVEAFLAKRIEFLKINQILRDMLEQVDCREPQSIDAVLDLDLNTRQLAEKLITSTVNT
jgi:1-deoxy-D-xylulose-5-phosphate reductoisomerase